MKLVHTKPEYRGVFGDAYYVTESDTGGVAPDGKLVFTRRELSVLKPLANDLAALRRVLNLKRVFEGTVVDPERLPF